MVAVSISRVKPGSVLLTVLILVIPRYTDGTTGNTVTDISESSAVTTKYVTTGSHSNTEYSTATTESTSTPKIDNDNLTFESSCVALIWLEAKGDCINKGSTIFTVQDLTTTIGGKVLNKAYDEHTTIWIESNGTTCKTAFNGSFHLANCSDTNHYVCKGNTSTSSERYIPCRQGSTVTSTPGTNVTQGSSGSTPLNPSPSTQKVIIIASATGVIVALVAVFILSAFCIMKRNKKPIKYAVRAESAMYHKQHPYPDKVEEPNLADVQVVSSTDAGIGNGVMNEDVQNGEYDILCVAMGSQRKFDESESTAVYSHLQGNVAVDDSSEESHYDTTKLPQYDRRPVDKIYDRLHVSDQ